MMLKEELAGINNLLYTINTVRLKSHQSYCIMDKLSQKNLSDS